MPHCYAFKSWCAAKEPPTALNVLHAHGSLRGADIAIFTSVNVCIYFILWNILFCECLTALTVFFKINFLMFGFCCVRTDQQAELLGRQGSGSISCHEHKSLWWARWQPSSKPLQPIWESWCGRYVFVRILFFSPSEDSVEFKFC